MFVINVGVYAHWQDVLVATQQPSHAGCVIAQKLLTCSRYRTALINNKAQATRHVLCYYHDLDQVFDAVGTMSMHLFHVSRTGSHSYRCHVPGAMSMYYASCQAHQVRTCALCGDDRLHSGSVLHTQEQHGGVQRACNVQHGAHGAPVGCKQGLLSTCGDWNACTLVRPWCSTDMSAMNQGTADTQACRKSMMLVTEVHRLRHNQRSN